MLAYSTTLTPRERQVLALIVKGLHRREVAAELFVSPLTVQKHLANAYEKLGARNAVHALFIVVGGVELTTAPGEAAKDTTTG